jgi:hypothetical protein
VLMFGAEVGWGLRLWREAVGSESQGVDRSSALWSPELPTVCPKIGSDFRA